MAEYGAIRAAWVRVFGPPKPKTLRPSGHSAAVERLRIPLIVLVSVAMTGGAVYVLAEPLVIQLIGAWRVRDWAVLIPDLLALFAITVTGFALDYTFVTACIRFGMHIVRRETWWAIAALAALLFAGGTEAITLAYLFYKVDPSSVARGTVSVVANIPSYLFWIRSGGALACVAYLVMGVLPPTVQRGDLKRIAGGQAGGNAVTLIQRLLTVSAVQDTPTLVNLLNAYLGIFLWATPGSKNAHADAKQEDAELVAMLDRLNAATDTTLDTTLALPAPSRTQRTIAQAHQATRTAQQMHDGHNGHDRAPDPTRDDWQGYDPARDDHEREWDDESAAETDDDDGPARSGYSMYAPHLPALNGASNGHGNGNGNGHRRRDERNGNGTGNGRRGDALPDSMAPYPTMTADLPDAAPRRSSRTRRAARPQRMDAGMSLGQREALRQQRYTIAEQAFEADPSVGVRELARQIAGKTGIKCDTGTARDILKDVRHDEMWRHAPLYDDPGVEQTDGIDLSDLDGDGDRAYGAPSLPRHVVDELDAAIADDDWRFATNAIPALHVGDLADAARRAAEEYDN